jgi:hypothetical protein
MVAEMARRAEEADTTPLDYACDWVASGGTLRGLADDIASQVQLDITRNMVSVYLRNQPDGLARLEEARREGAGGLVEEGLDILDAEVESREDAMRNKNRADYRARIAGFWNPSEYGERGKGGTTVNLNLGQLHLTALRAAEPAPLLAAVEGEDYETLLPGTPEAGPNIRPIDTGDNTP